MSRIGRSIIAAAVMALTAAPTHVNDAAGAQVQPAAATDAALEQRVKEVASELRCVVCQGLSIQDSPSALAQEMRAVVRDQLAAGKSPDEVKAYFVDRYGEWVLLRPDPTGLNLLVYVLPVMLFIGGASFIFVQARRWTRAAPAATDPVHPS